MKSFVCLIVFGLTLGFTTTMAEEMTPAMHGTIAQAEIEWGPCPPGLPAGCKTAVLQGDPSKPELFTMRVWLPDEYKVAPHFHPTQENLTVLSGKLHIGTGDTFDKANAPAISPGGFSWMGAEMHHFAWAEGETTFQVHAIGPFMVTYVNPADDPRTMKQ